MTSTVPRHVGLCLALVQFFFALSWTVYVLYLPQLAAQAGLPKAAVPWLLVLDQAVFLVADYACGIASDRIADATRRFGPAVLAATAVSGAAFVLMPIVSPAGSPALLVAATLVWAVGSAALRAPPMNLIGRYAARPSQPRLLALSMLGLGLAAALAPYLGLALRERDPRLPFALAGLAVVLATAGIVWAERVLLRVREATGTAPAAAPAGLPPAPRPPWPAALAAAVLAALAFQLHVFLNSTPMYLRFASPEALASLAPVFWVGFNLGLWPASLATKRHGGFAVTGASALLAAGAALAAALAGSLPALVAAQALAGLAWSGLLMSAFAAALDYGHTGREGRSSGALSSVLALAALLRLGAVLGGVSAAAGPGAAGPLAGLLAWAPAVLWLAAGLLLLGLWRTAPLRAQPA
ncbi:MFS transporter [Piscinibacter sakaiensis]|uniref:MFS transporter n=1 Tax=Piscinibacter sakaiensis TaxID=1547922 RepID=A0A0K8P4D0_PISS1|nr:MFS transporter [Piscinibacter sakaiensis]GAP37518.1 hypothetical protein ISF6_3373 [Piscinibacter sakaiensis]